MQHRAHFEKASMVIFKMNRLISLHLINIINNYRSIIFDNVYQVGRALVDLFFTHLFFSNHVFLNNKKWN